LARALALALALSLAACTQGAKSGLKLVLPPVESPPLAVAKPKAPVPALPSGAERIEGTPSYRVVWEALAVERYRLEHPKLQGARVADSLGTPDVEVVLLNASYVGTAEQVQEDKSQPATGRVARIADADMLELVRGIEASGFWRYAKPTGSLRAFFGSEAARGRVTVEKDGESWTLLSLRGLGLQGETREIPGIYAQVKAAISILKNSAPNMRVTGGKLGDRPSPPGSTGTKPSGSGTTSPPPAGSTDAPGK
jgi:hypothetical protein